jgi:hypothetical protein
MPGRLGVFAPLAFFIQQAKRMRRILLSLVASLARPNFSTLSHKRHEVLKKITDIKCVFV